MIHQPVRSDHRYRCNGFVSSPPVTGRIAYLRRMTAIIPKVAFIGTSLTVAIDFIRFSRTTDISGIESIRLSWIDATPFLQTTDSVSGF